MEAALETRRIRCGKSDWFCLGWAVLERLMSYTHVDDHWEDIASCGRCLSWHKKADEANVLKATALQENKLDLNFE